VSTDSLHLLQEDAVALIDDATWYEAALLCDPLEFYAYLLGQVPGGVGMFHHFYEPWHPGYPVARILVPSALEDDVLEVAEGMDAVASILPWDREENDRELYGDEFLIAMAFFQSASALSHRDDLTLKLVHCLLNSHGFGIKDEIRFAAKFLWNRLTINPRLTWRSLRTGRKWREKP